MINFPEDFFREQERDGFVVREMMKRAWAAQLEEYKVLEKICDDNGLRVFADFGTLLGAVRHRGFVPWDDDLDVSMPRADYMKLIDLIISGEIKLPDGYELISIYNRNDYYNLVSRFMGAVTISTKPERLEKFHGFPYTSGIDIFPLDYIPGDNEEFETWKDLLAFTGGVHFQLRNNEISDEDLNEALPVIEQACGITFVPEEDEPLAHQLAVLCDRLYSLYTDADADFMGSAIVSIASANSFIHKSGMNRFLDLPFECTTVRVPANYEVYIRMRYGDDYMKPVRYELHDYPFYRSDEELLEKFLQREDADPAGIEIFFNGIRG